MIKLYLTIGIAAVSLAAGGFFVYRHMAQKMFVLEANYQAQALQINNNLRIMESTAMHLQDYNEDIIEIRNQTRQNASALAERTDDEFTLLLREKPGLMRTRINNASNKVFDDIAELFEEQENEK